MRGKSVRIFLCICLFFLIGFIGLTYVVMNNKTNQIDQNVISFVRSFEHEFITLGMKLFSFIGAVWPVVILSFILLFIIYKVYRQKREVVLFTIVSIGSTSINYSLKNVFKRDRPLMAIAEANGFSYPSGHTVSALTLYGIITFLFWKHIQTKSRRNLLLIVAIFMIFMISMSRVYLRVHYMSDVIGGYLLGGLWLYVTIWMYQYLQERKYKQKESEN